MIETQTTAIRPPSVRAPRRPYLGLFGRLGPGAVVSDVTLKDVSIAQTAWSQYVGALAGDMTKGSCVERCELVNGMIHAPSKVGLLVGECAEIVRQCHLAV